MSRTRHKWTREEVVEYLSKFGFVLVSESVPNTTTKLHMKCAVGHDVYMSFHTFRSGGNRCAECSGKKRPSFEKLKSSFETVGYRLISKKYVNQHTKLQYECDKGHYNHITWSNFNKGHRCPDCARNKKFEYVEVQNFFEEAGLSLLSTKYYNCSKPLDFVCEKGHKSRISLANLRTGYGCNVCARSGISKQEWELVDRYKGLGIEVVHSDRSVIGPLELDLYFPANNVAVEYCGLYWHSELGGHKDKYYHLQKRRLCEEKGIRLITVFGDEYRKNKSTVLSRIDNALGISAKRIMGRKTTLVLPVRRDVNEFLSSYHLQGFAPYKAAFGLEYEGVLIAVATVSALTRAHTGAHSTLELKRLCFTPGVVVQGGASKLFRPIVEYAVSNGYTSIKSYCDMRYGNPFNPVYEKLGFRLVSESKPSPSYIDTSKYLERINCYSLRKTPEERLTGKTEWELRRAQGYDRIWDCGHRSYIYEIK